MGTIPVIYSPRYKVNLGYHVFPTEKYGLVVERLKQENVITDADILAPAPAREDDILRVHTAEYFEKVKNVTLPAYFVMRLEMPFTKEISEAALLSCGGTVLACREAAAHGGAYHCGGGFHHAFPDHGEGFCVLNDIAVAAKAMQSAKIAEKILIVDCDLHQGNGTAHIFKANPSVFTFSMYQENIYPFPKLHSSLDVALQPGVGDEEYLQHLRHHIPRIIEDFKPRLIIYLAGAGPYKLDKLGGLKLSIQGLRQRDILIRDLAYTAGIPIVISPAGGYAQNIDDTVTIHANTYQVFNQR